MLSEPLGTGSMTIYHLLMGAGVQTSLAPSDCTPMASHDWMITATVGPKTEQGPDLGLKIGSNQSSSRDIGKALRSYEGILGGNRANKQCHMMAGAVL